MVMAYNEEAELAKTVSNILQTLAESGISFEVIIINDGSSDKTGEVADALVKDQTHLRVIHHGTNVGVGEVYWTGFHAAQGEFITFFPADGQFPPSIIVDFLSPMEKNDMVLGYISEHKRPWIGRLFSTLERLLYTLLVGRLPKFQGIMMFRRSLLDSVKLCAPRGSRGWAVVMELIIKTQKAGYRIESRETGYLPRVSGRSHVNNLSSAWVNFTQMVHIWRSM